MIYQLVVHTSVIQFKDTFAKYFSPHQFGVATSCECDTMVHEVKTMLNLHSKWVVIQMDIQNTFNSISQTTIF